MFTWSPRVLERREALFRAGVIKGGLFWTMKAFFIMEDERINDVFSRIVIAGGGSVVRYYNTLGSLATNPPSPREIMQVFLDPWPKVIKSVEFQSVVAHCKSKNLNIHFLHYKYLYNLIDGKKNTTVDKWDITSEVRTCIRLQSPGKASPGTGALRSQSFPREKFSRGSIKNRNLYM